MSGEHVSVYEFVFRGLLTETALDSAGRQSRVLNGQLAPDLVDALGLDVLDELAVASASRMSLVYTAIAAWENSVRRFVESTMLEHHGDGWWETTVSEKVRRRAESRRDEESKIRWHVPRGEALIYFTELSDLVSIIAVNWTAFEPFLRSQDWVSGLLGSVERSRNVIMHSGELGSEDIERVGMNIRDWVRQVGA